MRWPTPCWARSARATSAIIFPTRTNAGAASAAWFFSSRSGCLLEKRGAVLENVDASVIAEAPKIAPHLEKMKARLGAALGIPPQRVNLKATTNEKLGFAGRGEGYRGHGRGLRDVAGLRSHATADLPALQHHVPAVGRCVPLDPRAGASASTSAGRPSTTTAISAIFAPTSRSISCVVRCVISDTRSTTSCSSPTWTTRPSAARARRSCRCATSRPFTGEAFLEDAKTLNIEIPERTPNATDHIPEMVALIEKLIAKKSAYVSEDGSVYFRIASFPRYGCLCHLDLAGMISGARVNQDEYEKEGVGDFVLWKKWNEADGDVGWDSPWGKGRPGWHIECSALSMGHLGPQIDIHGGGTDLRFPHHENEIAQSEAATGSDLRAPLVPR